MSNKLPIKAERVKNNNKAIICDVLIQSFFIIVISFGLGFAIINWKCEISTYNE